VYFFPRRKKGFTFPLDKSNLPFECDFLYSLLLSRRLSQSQAPWERRMLVLWTSCQDTVPQLLLTLQYSQFYKPEGHGFDFRSGIWDFSVTQSFRPHYGPGVDSASNRNEYQGSSLLVNAAGWQLYHLHVQIVENPSSITTRSPRGLSRLVKGQFYLTFRSQ
jgi:hypothetical protein